MYAVANNNSNSQKASESAAMQRSKVEDDATMKKEAEAKAMAKQEEADAMKKTDVMSPGQ